jgi:SAM-dependent methyltransferase
MKYWGKWGKKNTTLENIWTENTLANKETISNFDGVWTLPNCLDKAVIVVGASPCMKQDWQFLKDLPDHYVIIAVNSILQLLLDHDIKPHYVIAVDGGPDIPKHLNVNSGSDDVTLLACNSVSPEVFKIWHGGIKIVPYTAVKDKELKKWLKEKFGKEPPSGGNAFNNAVGIATHVMKTSIVVFMGNELSWKGKNYYADKPSFNDNTMVFPTKGVNRRQTYTNTVLYQYKIWLEAFCKQNNHINFYNVSGGILGYSEMTGKIEEIRQMSFNQAKAEIDAGMELFNNINTRERIKYNIAYSSDKIYDPSVGEGAWKDIIEQVPFNRGLDVGCGPGYGIKVARDAGKEVFGIDISDVVYDKWKELGIEKYCEVAPANKIPAQDKTFDLVLCTEVMEHIPEELVDESLREIRRVACGMIYFTIANRYVPKSHQWIDGQFQPHLTVKPHRWWKTKLIEHGFDVKRVRSLECVSHLYVCK